MTIKNALVQAVDTEVFLAASQHAVTTILFCNVSTTQTVTVSLFAVPYGDTPQIGTQVLNNIPLTPGETFAMDSERFVLETGDAFIATASVPNVVCATVSTVPTT